MAVQRTPLKLGSSSYKAISGRIHFERVKNFYAEGDPGGGFALIGAPGLSSFATPGDGPIRGMVYMDSLIWVVSGQELYTVDVDGTATLVGPFLGNQNVSMIASSAQGLIGIASSLGFYTANSTTITQVFSGVLSGATYLQGLGIFVEASNNLNIWATDVDDFTTVGGTSLSQADTDDSLIVGVISDHQEVLVAKEKSIEFWQNTGASPFPLEKDPSGFVEIGVRAGKSLAKAFNFVYFLGNNDIVYRLAGRQPEPVSPLGVSELIKSLTEEQKKVAIGWTYTQAGHTFYCLSMPGLGLAYDITTQTWAERESFGLGRWRASHHVEAFGKQIVGDYTSGQLGELDLTTYTEYGSTFRSEVAHPVSAGDHWALMHELELEAETGVGIESGQGSDPEVMMDFSDDGGITWSDELRRDLGQQIDRARYEEVRWQRLGRFKDERIVRFAVSDPVKRVFTGASARLEAAA